MVERCERKRLTWKKARSLLMIFLCMKICKKTKTKKIPHGAWSLNSEK